MDKQVKILKIWPRHFLALLLLSLTANTYAGSCNQNYCDAKVQTIYPSINGKVYLRADADMTPLDCTLAQGNYMVLEASNARHSEMFSILLAAHLANRNVIFRITNGSPICAITYIAINQ